MPSLLRCLSHHLLFDAGVFTCGTAVPLALRELSAASKLAVEVLFPQLRQLS